MAIKTYRPVTPVLRYKTTLAYKELLSNDEPYKPLLEFKRGKAGRNNHGHITSRHRGGGVKRFYRIIDFKRNKFDIPSVVETVEYDPNRSCFISLLKFADGERRYILATANMKPGMKVISTTKECEALEGNCLPLKMIPPGTMVHNIEMKLLKGGQIVRSAGSYAEVVAREHEMVQLRLPSGEIRNFQENLMATVGQVSNLDHMNVVVGSAGRNRLKGWRPHVRGVAMNPVDHPMGGGEGKTSGGGHPVSPWGQKAKGLKTRNRKKPSSKWIVRRRK